MEIGKIDPSTSSNTADVCSPYTNIPNIERIFAVAALLISHRSALAVPKNSSVIESLELVVTLNNFQFNDKNYVQIGGTAVCQKVAPRFANIFMSGFEDKYVYTYPPQPLLWVRFIDDVMFLWQHGDAKLTKFKDYLNNCHHNI